MDTYGHLFEGSDRDSADKMQKLFGPAKTPGTAPRTQTRSCSEEGVLISWSIQNHLQLPQDGESSDLTCYCSTVATGRFQKLVLTTLLTTGELEEPTRPVSY